MDNLTAGNPRAHAVRVYFENSGSAKIYEGMPLCYNWDTTDNWFGGSVANTGEITATDTAAITVANESRYIRVELPATGNFAAFAGVVKKGGWCGKSDARVLDIYVPNGAIVPVRIGIATTINRTILAISNGLDYLGHPLGGSRSVAIAEETGTGSTDEECILARLDTNLFIYQLSQGGALYAGTDATACAETQIVNNLRVSSAHTGGQFVHLFQQVNLTGTMAGEGAGATGIYSAMDTSGTCNFGGTSYLRSIFATLTIGGTITAGGVMCAIEAQVYNTSVTFTKCAHVCALWCDSRMVTAPSDGDAEIMYLSHNGTCTLGQAIYIRCSNKITNLFKLSAPGALISGSSSTASHKIAISIDGTTRYLMVCSS